MGSNAASAIPALIEAMADPTPVDPNVCNDGRWGWRRDSDYWTSPGHEAASALIAVIGK